MDKAQLIARVKDIDKVINEIKGFDFSDHSVETLRRRIQAMIRMSVGYGEITKVEGDKLFDAYGYCKEF